MGTYREGDSTKARRLRAQMTDAERKLWSVIRNRQLEGHKFVRQLPVGPYVADVACREAGLIVEVDGGQHSDSAGDLIRTKQIESNGYRVIRFWNNDVLRNLEGVAEALTIELNRPHTPGRFAVASPLPQGENGRMERP